jgi:hypothetical protein
MGGRHGHGPSKRQSPRERLINTAPADVLPSPSAFIGGIRNKGQLTYNIKTTPKAPKVNGTMTVKVKARGADRPHGRAAVLHQRGEGSR